MSRAHKFSNLVGVAVPFVAFLVAIVLLWNTWFDWSDLAVLAIMYVLTGLGVTLGFHRLLTHRSFQTYKPVEYVLAGLGSMAVQGPVMTWVADHRKHHAHTDREGDPHSPHGHGGGFRGAVAGLRHRAAVRPGLGDRRNGRGPPHRRALGRRGADLPPAPHHLVDQLGLPFFGSRRFAIDDHSTNVFWLSLLSFGESWHHNHHAFPRSALHGLRWWELDPTGWVVRAMKRLRLAWNVVEITPDRQREKLA
jgi:stearoyl-CoA desaturase (Delta-9 desaturase)